MLISPQSKWFQLWKIDRRQLLPDFVPRILYPWFIVAPVHENLGKKGKLFERSRLSFFDHPKNARACVMGFQACKT
jgi:hypothetical protein